MWDWAFFLLNRGSSPARGLGRWQWVVSPERWSSAWVLCAEGQPPGPRTSTPYTFGSGATLCSGACFPAPVCPLWSPCARPGCPYAVLAALSILGKDLWKGGWVACETRERGREGTVSPGRALNKHVLCQLGARRRGTRRGGGMGPAQHQSGLCLNPGRASSQL